MPQPVVENQTRRWIECQQILKRILATPGHPKIKNLENGEMVAPAVILLATKHMDFIYNHNARRVQWIRPIFRSPKWESCWRTVEASVLPIAEDYGVPMLGKDFSGSIRGLFDDLPDENNYTRGRRVSMS